MPKKKKKSPTEIFAERNKSKIPSRSREYIPKQHDKQDQQKWRRLVDLEQRMMKKVPGGPRAFSARSVYDTYYARKYGKKKK